MTREDVLKIMPDATQEQITALLNGFHTELNVEKGKTETFKQKSIKADELQAQLDEINEKGLSDLEKATKDRDTALKDVEALKLQVKQMELKNKFAEQGIVGDNAEKLIQSMSNGSFDFDVLKTVIAEREANAATAKEREIAGKAGNPTGATNIPGASEMSIAEKLASQMSKSNSNANTNILNNYL